MRKRKIGAEERLLRNLAKRFKTLHTKGTPSVYIYSSMISTVKRHQQENGAKPYHKELINNLWAQACQVPVVKGI